MCAELSQIGSFGAAGLNQGMMAENELFWFGAVANPEFWSTKYVVKYKCVSDNIHT